MKIRKITWEEIYNKIVQIKSANHGKKFYGVPRGGQIIAGLTGHAVDTVEEADIIVDDILDSGATYERFRVRYPNKKFIAAFNRNEFNGKAWIEFPWEVEETKTERQEQVKRLVLMIKGDYITNRKAINNLIKQIENNE